MNTQEFAEWLREELNSWETELKLMSKDPDADTMSVYFAKGHRSAFNIVLNKLTTLDSSHDLPSAKGVGSLYTSKCLLGTLEALRKEMQK